MIDLIDSESAKEWDVVKALNEYQTLDYGDLLDYPEDVDAVLNFLDDNVKSDWEMVQSLKVAYGKWSKVLVAIFFFNEDHDCETLYFNDEFDWEDEQEVYAKLEEEKDEPKVLDFDNIKWGVFTGGLLNLIVVFLILKPFATPKANWVNLCIFLFLGICYTLGSINGELGECRAKKPRTALYRRIGNFSSLIVVLFGSMYIMWGFVAGETMIIDGGSRKVIYKEEVFDFERIDIKKK